MQLNFREADAVQEGILNTNSDPTMDVRIWLIVILLLLACIPSQHGAGSQAVRRCVAHRKANNLRSRFGNHRGRAGFPKEEEIRCSIQFAFARFGRLSC